MSEHNPQARYCIVVDVGIPISELRDDVGCRPCDENRALLRIDPDFADEYLAYPDPPGAGNYDEAIR